MIKLGVDLLRFRVLIIYKQFIYVGLYEAKLQDIKRKVLMPHHF